MAFLFNEHANLNILSTEIFEDGRMLSLKMEIDGLNLQIINIYAPNVPSERKILFKKITDKLDETYVHIIAGDFNCVMDGSFDRKPPANNQDQGHAEMNHLIQQNNLEDILSKRFPTKQLFTISRGSSKSRIDLFLTSKLLDRIIRATSIVHFPFSDHDAVKLNVDFSQTAKGPGIWKMNVQTIQSSIFRECIERLWPKWASEIELYESPTVWWEITKYKIKHLTIETRKSLNITKLKFLKLENILNEI